MNCGVSLERTGRSGQPSPAIGKEGAEQVPVLVSSVLDLHGRSIAWVVNNVNEQVNAYGALPWAGMMYAVGVPVPPWTAAGLSTGLGPSLAQRRN